MNALTLSPKFQVVITKHIREALTQARHFASAIAQLKQGKLVNVDESVALHAAKLSIAHTLPMADALTYATALLNKATVYTQAAHFDGLPSVRYFSRSA